MTSWPFLALWLRVVDPCNVGLMCAPACASVVVRPPVVVECIRGRGEMQHRLLPISRGSTALGSLAKEMPSQDRYVDLEVEVFIVAYPYRVLAGEQISIA